MMWAIPDEPIASGHSTGSKEFWGIWCGSCVTSLPVVDRIREKFEPRGGVFLSIHTPPESTDKFRKLFDLKKASLLSAIDEGQGDDNGQRDNLSCLFCIRLSHTRFDRQEG
jgi:thiol-disulfide isomerase/thioredoxin